MVPDGDTGALRTMEDVLSYAASKGVVCVRTVCSLVGGYSETSARQHWTATATGGPGALQTGVGRGHTQDDAIVSALHELGVVW